MTQLAKRRTLKHKALIGAVERKVNDIKKRHKHMGNKGKIDYETDLVMMEDNDFMEDKKYIADESDEGGEINESPIRPSPEDDAKKTKAERMKKQLLENKQNFIFSFEETLVNFKKSMEIMDRQAEITNRFTEDINSFEKKTIADNGASVKEKVAPSTSDSPRKQLANAKGNGSLYMSRLNEIGF
jgi:hypothetical protein